MIYNLLFYLLKHIAYYVAMEDEYKQLKIKKLQIFYKLENLKHCGIQLTQRYTLESNYEQMKDEYDFHMQIRKRKMAQEQLLVVFKFINNRINDYNKEQKIDSIQDSDNNDESVSSDDNDY